MRIGLVLECTDKGPDRKVYADWIGRIIGPGADLRSACLGSKKYLIQRAGTSAKDLFDIDGCEKVFVIWDAWPTWKEDVKPDPEADMEAVARSLRAAGVVNPCVYLLCVDRMLETLLIVDNKALNAMLQIPVGKQRPGNQNSPRRVVDPKAYLDKWFLAARKGPYRDFLHAEGIAKAVGDFTRLRAHTREFSWLEQSVAQFPCTPPLAWTP